MDAVDARLTEMGLYDKPYEASLKTDLAAGDAGALLRALSHIRMHFLYLAEKVQENVLVQKDAEEAESAAATTIVLQQAEAQRERRRVSRGVSFAGVCCAVRPRTALPSAAVMQPPRQAPSVRGSASADVCSRAHGKLGTAGLVEGSARCAGTSSSLQNAGHALAAPAAMQACSCVWQVNLSAESFPHILRGKQKAGLQVQTAGSACSQERRGQ